VRCPVCKADNTAGPNCRRCKADLTLLFALEEQREQELRAVGDHLGAERWTEAAGAAARADGLRRDEESLRLLAVTALLCRDFARAWTWYGELQGRASPAA
jgi:hypothetical protein